MHTSISEAGSQLGNPLTKPIVLTPVWKRAWSVARVSAGTAFVLLGIVELTGQTQWVVSGVMASIGLSLIGLEYWYRKRYRKGSHPEIQPHEYGFAIVIQDKLSSFSLRTLKSVSFWEKSASPTSSRSSDKLRTTILHLRFWMRNDPVDRPSCSINAVIDPMDGDVRMLYQSLTKLVEEQTTQIETDARRGGKGNLAEGSLSQSILNWRDQSVNLTEVQRIAPFTEGLGIWTRQDDWPAMIIPQEAPDWSILQRMLPRISPNIERDRGNSGIGRIETILKPSAKAKAIYWTVSVVMGLVTLTTFVQMWRNRDPLLFGVVLVLAAVATPFVIAALQATRKQLFLYERGVGQMHLRGENQLSFEEIGSFTHVSYMVGLKHEQAIDGFPPEAEVALAIVPRLESSKPAITYRIYGLGSDQQAIQGWCFRLNQYLASRLRRHLLDGDITLWGSYTLSSVGIVLQDESVIPFSQIASARIENGMYNLYRAEEELPFASIPLESTDFQTTRMVFEDLQRAARQRTQSAPSKGKRRPTRPADWDIELDI